MTRITRRKLYEKVWATPIETLAEEYGMSGRGLSKLCKRHKIPTPPRGYWAKVQAGQKLPQSPLPKLSKEIASTVQIQTVRPPKEVAKRNRRDIQKARAATKTKISAIKVPTDMRNLHWIVARWVDEHKRAHGKARKEAHERRHHDWDLHWGPSDAEIDLTERDKYRLHMTSAFLKCLEANGGKAIEGKINGELRIACSGQSINILVKEKMLQDRRKPSQQKEEWTAYPSHHNSALRPAGLLRIHVKTYIGAGGKEQWIETESWNGGEFLASVVGEVLNMGPILVRRHEEAEERHRQYFLEEQRRIDSLRLAQLEAERWQQFKAFSSDWDEVVRLRKFLSEIQKRQDEFAYEIEGMPLKDYITWAKVKIDELDPFFIPELKKSSEA